MKLSVSHKDNGSLRSLRFRRQYVQSINSERGAMSVNEQNISLTETDNFTSNPIFTIEERQAMCDRLQAVIEVIKQNQVQIESLRNEISKLENESDELCSCIYRIKNAYDLIRDTNTGNYRIRTDGDLG